MASMVCGATQGLSHSPHQLGVLFTVVGGSTDVFSQLWGPSALEASVISNLQRFFQDVTLCKSRGIGAFVLYWATIENGFGLFS